jgi:hypothetical protein
MISPRQPWPGENRAVPERIRGHRVLSAIKLIPGRGTRVHRWIVVTEQAPDIYGIERVGYDHQGNLAVDDSAFGVRSYRAALGWMIRIAEESGTVPDFADQSVTS